MSDNVSSELPKELLGICLKIHAAGGDKAIADFAASKGKVMPPIKLSKSEMHYLQGGCPEWYSDMCVGFARAARSLGLVDY